MGSQIVRTAISPNNRYYISKERRLELTHFCLQYKEWQHDYNNLKHYPSNRVEVLANYSGMTKESFVEKQAIKAAALSRKIEMIEECARETDDYIGNYIFKAATEGVGFTYLEQVYNMPCGRDMFYDRLKKFYWLLDKVRES